MLETRLRTGLVGVLLAGGMLCASADRTSAKDPAAQPEVGSGVALAELAEQTDRAEDAETDFATSPFAAKATGQHWQLIYDVYFGGLHLAQIFGDLRYNDRMHALRTYFQTTGLIKLISEVYGTSLSVARGGAFAEAWGDSRLLIAGDLVQARASRVRDGLGSLVFSLDHAKQGTTPPEPLPLDDRHRKGALDPFGAFVGGLRAIAQEGDECEDIALDIFDGQTRYAARMTPFGKERAKASDYSFFEGDTFVCRLDVRELVSEKRKIKQGEKPPEVLVMFGRPAPDLPPLMVRLLVRLKAGSGIAYLKAARAGKRTFGPFDEGLAELDPRALDLKADLYSLDGLRRRFSELAAMNE